MALNIPLVFLFLLIVGAIISWVVGRWQTAQLGVALLTTLILLIFTTQVPLESNVLALGQSVILQPVFNFVGRSLTFSDQVRPALTVLFLMAMLFFIGGFSIQLERTFVTGGLLVLMLVAATILVKPFQFAALFLQILAALAVFLLSDVVHFKTRGALRLLVFFTIGVPFVLLAGWQLEGAGNATNGVDILDQAALLLSIGFLILLSVFPFHSWVPVALEEANSYAAAFVVTVVNLAVIFVLISSLADIDWLRSNYIFQSVFGWGAIATIVISGIFAVGQRSYGRLMGYALLSDLGATYLTFTLTDYTSYQLGLVLLIIRVPAVVLWGIGIGALAPDGDDSFEALRGLAWRKPFSALAVFIGGLSLIGFPLTISFPVRWQLYQALIVSNAWGAYALMLASVCIILAYARGARLLLDRSALPEAETPSDSDLAAAESPVNTVMCIIGAAALLIFGIFPQFILPIFTALAQSFPQLVG